VLIVIATTLPSCLGVIALAAMTATGVLTALAAHPAAGGTGAFGPAAQACALIALMVALTPAAQARSGRLSWPGRRDAGTS
jgi:hypothetical protein